VKQANATVWHGYLQQCPTLAAEPAAEAWRGETEHLKPAAWFAHWNSLRELRPVGPRLEQSKEGAGTDRV